MPNYQNGKIYKLWSPQGTDEEIYYGSTCDELYKRKSHHKTSSRKCTSSIIFEKYDDVRIELVEKCSCNDKEELLKKEGEYIRNNKCLNKVIPCRTFKEYRKNNKEKIAEQQKAYYEKNKEKIAENKKQTSKIYREKNKEVIAEQKKEYRENNKEKIKEKVTCECGCIIGKNDLARHKRTNKHIKLMNDLE